MSKEDKYILRLFIAGMTVENQTSIVCLKKELSERLGRNYTLEIIDVFEHPELAESEKIIATPTLLRILPDPIQQVILNLNMDQKLIYGMDMILNKDNNS